MSQMNRQQRRAMKANMNQTDYVRFLERQNREQAEQIQHLQQVETMHKGIIRSMQANGTAHVIVSESANGVTEAVSVSQVHRQVKAAVDLTLLEANELESATLDVLQSVSALTAAAMCTNGRETRLILQTADNELLIAVDNLDTVCKKERIFTLTDNLQAAIVAFVKGVRPLVKAYLVEETGAAQESLQNWLKNNNTELADLKREIDDLPKRGRAYDKMLDLAGQMLYSYPEPNRGKNWQLIHNLYDDLRDIPEHARQNEQRELLSYIETSFLINGRIPDKRDAGTWVSEQRNRWKSRIQIESE